MAIDGLMAAGGALATGVDPDAILAGLAAFDGVGRRFELKGEVGGVTVLDDYAHHPTAMRATFEAARRRYPGRRLWAVYEPLTFHRTAAMLDAVRRGPRRGRPGGHHRHLGGPRPGPDDHLGRGARGGRRPRAAACRRSPSGSPEAAAAWLADAVEPGDVVLVMGGGRSYVAAEQLVERLRARA